MPRARRATPSRNGHNLPAYNRAGEVADPISVNKLEALVANLSTLTRGSLRGRTGEDPRRSIEDSCGYPQLNDWIDPEFYALWYERHEIARRVIELMPRECWKVTPAIRESQEADSDTPFDQAVLDLPRGLDAEPSWLESEEGVGDPVNMTLRQADIQAGIGQYAVILLGLDDGKQLSEPVEGIIEEGSLAAEYEMKPKKVKVRVSKDQELEIETRGPRPTANVRYPQGEWKGQRYRLVRNQDEEPQSEEEEELDGESKKGLSLKFLRVFNESLAQVVQWEINKSSARYGQPKMYLLTFNDPRSIGMAGQPQSTEMVHWTRVVHVPGDSAGVNPLLATPRCLPVHNRLMDLQKILGASGEGSWKAAFDTKVFETHPSLGGDVQIDRESIEDAIERYQNELQNYLIGVGGTWKSLAPALTDLTPHFEMHLKAIAISLGVPFEALIGNEIGLRSSEKTDEVWNERIAERQNNHLTPNHLRRFYDRLIWLRVLPEPKANKAIVENVRMLAPNRVVRVRGGFIVVNQDRTKTFVKGDGSYRITWPDLSSQSDAERADIFTKRMTAIGAYIGGGVEAIMPPKTMLVDEAGYGEEQAQEMLDEAAQAEEDKLAEQQVMLEEQGLQMGPDGKPINPNPQLGPDGKPLPPQPGQPGVPQMGPDGKPLPPQFGKQLPQDEEAVAPPDEEDVKDEEKKPLSPFLKRK